MKGTCKLRSVQYSEERMHLTQPGTQYNSLWQTAETSNTVNNSPIQDHATRFFELAFSHFAPLKGHIVRSLEWTHLQNFKNTFNDLKQFKKLRVSVTWN